MPDITSQPTGDKGVNPLYSGAVFLWNGAVPGKNQINGATTSPKGTNTTGAAGKFQHMSNTDGAFSFAITKPTTAYTLVIVSCHPTASVSSTKLVSIPGGNFRLESQTTGGGVYHTMVHTGSAAAANTYVTSVGSFNTNAWVYVAAYSSGTLRQYLKRGDGTNGASVTESIGYNNSGTAQIDIGEALGAAGQGVYAILLVPTDVGDTECQALRDNPWKMFADASSDLGGNVSLGDFILSGDFATGALSQLAGGISLDDFVLGGVLGLAPGIVTTNPFKNWTGTLLPGISVPNVVFIKLDRTQALALTSQTTDGAAVMTITNASLVTGTDYIMVSFNADGTSIGAELVRAA